MKNERLAYENKGQEEPEGENHGMRWLCLLAFPRCGVASE